MFYNFMMMIKNPWKSPIVFSVLITLFGAGTIYLFVTIIQLLGLTQNDVLNPQAWINAVVNKALSENLPSDLILSFRDLGTSFSGIWNALIHTFTAGSSAGSITTIAIYQLSFIIALTIMAILMTLAFIVALIKLLRKRRISFFFYFLVFWIMGLNLLFSVIMFIYYKRRIKQHLEGKDLEEEALTNNSRIRQQQNAKSFEQSFNQKGI